MNFLRQIFEGKCTPEMHYRFVRYGKGEYNKFFFEITKGKNSFKMKSSFDFANDFIKLISEKCNAKMAVKGKIIAPRDFNAEISAIVEPKNFSKRGKLFTAEIDAELSPEQLKAIYSKFEQNFILLGINGDGFKLKTGTSPPKPGGKLKSDFCSATLPLSLFEEFAWDCTDASSIKIRHLMKVIDIIIPPELKNEPAKARIEAKRKGVIERIIEADGKEMRKEVPFEA